LYFFKVGFGVINVIEIEDNDFLIIVIGLGDVGNNLIINPLLEVIRHNFPIVVFAAKYHSWDYHLRSHLNINKVEILSQIFKLIFMSIHHTRVQLN
jgi:hypothetical protein